MAEIQAQYSPFDFDLKRLDFITSTGIKMDLRAIMVELNVFEDIFANVMTGNLTVTDSKNLFGYIPVQGNEFLDIEFDKPSMNNSIKKTFRVYTRGNIIQNDMSNMSVTLNFCSEEMMVSKSMSFSKVYSGKLISDMVKDVGRNIFKINAKEFPDSHIETTKGIMNLTIPYYNCLQALNWLSSKAIGNYVGSTFFFYENRDGYWFNSIQKLFNIKQPVATYNHNYKNIGTKRLDPNQDFFDIVKYKIIKTPNTLESLYSGTYSGKLLTLDILRQKFDVGNLNADDLYAASQKLDPGRSYGTMSNRLGNQPATSYGGYVKFYPTNYEQNHATYINGKQEIHQTNIEKWMIERNAQIMQLLGTRLKLIVPGNNFIKIGDIITVNLPSVEPQTGPNENEFQRKLDPYMSGNYIITAVRHRIIPNRYETILEICKDTLKKSLPGSQNKNPAIGELIA